MLRKGVYLHEYMDDWEKFNETSIPEKEDFYSHLNMEYITDADYEHVLLNLKYQLQHEMKSFNYLIDHILYQISNTILGISPKNMRELLIILQ